MLYYRSTHKKMLLLEKDNRFIVDDSLNILLMECFHSVFVYLRSKSRTDRD